MCASAQGAKIKKTSKFKFNQTAYLCVQEERDRTDVNEWGGMYQVIVSSDFGEVAYIYKIFHLDFIFLPTSFVLK